MDGNHVVLDISSDEDVGFNWAASDGCDSEIDWSELFVNLETDVGDNQNCDKGYDSVGVNQSCDKGYDSDDVVVVKEVLAKPKRTKKFSGVANFAAQEEDDDCVILDGDPDKPVAEDKDLGYDSDDLVIVAEKGQVACRDYPHSRHLCVKFPFGSTLHSEHCNLCHCYVCDSLAPCGNWGNGNSSTDHCHATEKEESWKSERKRIKQVKAASVVSSADVAFWKELFYPIPPPAPPLAQICGSNGYLPGQAPSYDPPNILRTQRHPNPLSQQPIMNPCTNNFQRARVSNSNPHSVTAPAIFKRARALGKARATVAGVHFDSKQDNSNNSYNDYRLSYKRHMMNIRLASKQAETRQLDRGQVQPTVVINGNPGNPNENICAPVSPVANCNTSQQSQCFSGVLDLGVEEQASLTEKQPWIPGVYPDPLNLEPFDHRAFELQVLGEEDNIYTDCLFKPY